jgi:hypothetical protein
MKKDGDVERKGKGFAIGISRYCLNICLEGLKRTVNNILNSQYSGQALR